MVYAEEASCSSLFLNTESMSSSALPPDSNNNDDCVSVKDGETSDEGLTAGVCESGVTDEERCAAMLRAMDVSTAQLPQQQQRRPGLALSVEACLARFTEKEILSGANMITCETCTRAAANNNDDSSNSAASGGDHSSSPSKTSDAGRFDFVIS